VDDDADFDLQVLTRQSESGTPVSTRPFYIYETAQPLAQSTAQAALLFLRDFAAIRLLLYLTHSLKFTPRLHGRGTRGHAAPDSLSLKEVANPG